MPGLPYVGAMATKNELIGFVIGDLFAGLLLNAVTYPEDYSFLGPAIFSLIVLGEIVYLLSPYVGKK